MAIRAGASALGLVSEMPSGPGIVGEDTIASVARSVPPFIATFLLTSLQVPEAIIAQHRRCRTNTIQICDRIPIDAFAQLREALPGIALVQVVHIQSQSSVDEALTLGPYVNALLLDSGNQMLPIKELGGTGRTHDWRLSRQICEESTVPIILAGGLNPDNVADAVRTVHPFGVDLCSGVRSDGALDPGKLRRFFSAVHRADSAAI